MALKLTDTAMRPEFNGGDPLASSSQSSGGIGFFGALGLLFIGLKLGGAISWNWWWVLAPLWVPAAIGIAFVCVLIAAAALGGR